MEGDLVLPRDDDARAAARNRGPQQQQQEPAPGTEVAEGDVAAAAEDDDEAAVEEAVAGVPHVVTAEEAAAGTYSIDDVVLPLPGSESIYPTHATADVFRQLAEADGVSLDTAAHGSQDFSITALPGAYRHVLHHPADLEVRAVGWRGGWGGQRSG